MRRAVKIAGGVLAGLILLLAVAAGTFYFGGGPVLRWALNHPLSGVLGLPLQVRGPVSVAWGSPTKIVAEDVALGNASWAAKPEMFTAKRLEIDLFPGSLVTPPYHLARISLDHAQLLLEKSAKGQRNWEAVTKAMGPGGRGQFPTINQIAFTDSSLVFRNDVTGAVTDLALRKLDLNARDPTAPVRLYADGRFQQLPLRITGTIGPLAELHHPTKPYPVDLDGALGASGLAVKGTAAHPLAFTGVDARLSLTGRDLHAITKALGLPLPPVPDFRATGVLTGGDNDWTLKALSMKLGHSDIEGGIAIKLPPGKVPQIDANLTSSFVDLADFTGFIGKKPANATAPAPPPPQSHDDRIIPARPIAIHALPGVDATVKLYATRLAANKGLPLDRVTVGLNLEKGILTLKPLSFGLGGGTVAFDMTFDPSQKPPSLKLDLDIRHIDLHRMVEGPALPAMFKETRGILGGFIHFHSTGSSLRDFLGRMDGDAGLFVENGQFSQLLQELVDLNVLQALHLVATGDRPVPINCLVGRFNLKRGVATATTLLLDTTDSLLVGKGNVNFAAETVYIDLTPYHKHFTLLTLRTPVEARGTFAKPSFGLSKAGLIARLGAAVGLGVVAPPAALLPLIDTGLGKDNSCRRAFPAGENAPLSGSSTPPKR